ncbi:MAG: hypothetical protein ACRCYO_19385, partial [Bacteroidia bacterium]
MKRALLYFLLTITLLYTVRELMYVGVRKNKLGEFARLRQTFLEKTPCDVLIIGSSRAEAHFYPPAIDSATGLQTFNIGMSGATLPFIATTFEAYLENSPPPKYVILNIDWHTFDHPPDTVYLFPRYFPYLANKKLHEGISKRDGRFPFFKIVAPYSMPYFGTRYVNAAIRGYTGKIGQYDTTVVQGYTPVLPPVHSSLAQEIAALYNREVAIPNHIPTELRRIKKICETRNMKLIFVISPIHEALTNHISNHETLLQYVRSFAGAERIRLFD